MNYRVIDFHGYRITFFRMKFPEHLDMEKEHVCRTPSYFRDHIIEHLNLNWDESKQRLSLLSDRFGVCILERVVLVCFGCKDYADYYFCCREMFRSVFGFPSSVEVDWLKEGF